MPNNYGSNRSPDNKLGQSSDKDGFWKEVFLFFKQLLIERSIWLIVALLTITYIAFGFPNNRVCNTIIEYRFGSYFTCIFVGIVFVVPPYWESSKKWRESISRKVQMRSIRRKIRKMETVDLFVVYQMFHFDTCILSRIHPTTMKLIQQSIIFELPDHNSHNKDRNSILVTVRDKRYLENAYHLVELNKYRYYLAFVENVEGIRNVIYDTYSNNAIITSWQNMHDYVNKHRPDEPESSEK